MLIDSRFQRCDRLYFNLSQKNSDHINIYKLITFFVTLGRREIGVDQFDCINALSQLNHNLHQGLGRSFFVLSSPE